MRPPLKLLALPEDPSPYLEKLYAEVRAQGVPVRYVGGLTPSHTMNLVLLPVELLVARARGWNALHIHWVFGFGLPGAARLPWLRWAARRWFGLVLGVARLARLKVVWTAHNALPHEQVFPDDVEARRRLVQACDVVFVHSRAVLDQLAGLGVHPARVVDIRPGSVVEGDRAGALRVPGAGNAPRTAMFFGKVLEYKGVEDLATAARGLADDVDLRVVVAGACEDGELERRIRGKANGRVELDLRRIPEAELPALFARADVVVLPFRRISSSGSLDSAMAFGRPVIAPAVPAFEHVPDGPLIRYDGTIEGLTQTLSAVAREDAGALAARGEAARQLMASADWSEAARATVTALTDPWGSA